MEDTILNWKAEEYPHYEKGFGWYLTFFIIGVLLIGYEILNRDYFAALTFLIIFVILYFFTLQRPREVNVTLTTKGIIVDDTQIPYHSINNFWIVHHPEAKALHLHTNAYLNRQVVLQLGETDPDEVAGVLRVYIKETMPNIENVSHRIARKLRF